MTIKKEYIYLSIIAKNKWSELVGLGVLRLSKECFPEYSVVESPGKNAIV